MTFKYCWSSCDCVCHRYMLLTVEVKLFETVKYAFREITLVARSGQQSMTLDVLKKIKTVGQKHDFTL